MVTPTLRGTTVLSQPKQRCKPLQTTVRKAPAYPKAGQRNQFFEQRRNVAPARSPQLDAVAKMSTVLARAEQEATQLSLELAHAEQCARRGAMASEHYLRDSRCLSKNLTAVASRNHVV